MKIKLLQYRDIDHASIPFGKGQLKMMKITEVTGDDPDETGCRMLTYKNGELYNNFVLVWMSQDGHYFQLGSADSFMQVFGLLKPRAKAIENYITEQLHNEIPVIATKPGDFEDEAIISLTNVVDAARDAYGEESEDFKQMWSPEVETLVEQNVYIRNVLAKLGQMLEKGFNEAFHENVANGIVHMIRASKHINVQGNISGPTMASVEDLFRIVRERLTLTQNNGVPPHLFTDEHIPDILL